MFDLTGDFLLTYLVREIKDVVLKHPRFRESGGETLAQSSVGVQLHDVRVAVSSVRSYGTRLSPDYFMYTQKGYSVLGKLGDKEGLFVEWVRDMYQPEPAMYYLYVNSVDERTRDVELWLRKFKWASGSLSHAVGSQVYLRSGLTPADLGIPEGKYILNKDGFLLTEYVELSSGLVPLVDYWSLRDIDAPLAVTQGGRETLTTPVGVSVFKIYDANNGYVLRKDVDYVQQEGGVTLSPYSPPGSDLRITYLGRSAEIVHPENKISVTLSEGETVVPESIWIKTSTTTPNSLITGTDGSYYIKNLLQPGYRLRWDLKIDAGDSKSIVAKMSTSTDVIPGLMLAFGDKVYVGDEMAILVSPERTETYEVYGSTEDISFSIKVTANDRDTVNDLAFMIKEHLLVKSRDRHESAGLTIYEASMDTITEARDQSGTASTSTKEISISAASNWRYFVPLISQVSDVDISGVVPSTDFPGANWLPYSEALGSKSWGGSLPFGG